MSPNSYNSDIDIGLTMMSQFLFSQKKVFFFQKMTMKKFNFFVTVSFF